MNFKTCISLFMIFSFELYPKKIIVNKIQGTEKFQNKAWLNANSWFQITPLQDILKNNSQVSYLKVLDKVFFNYPKFSIATEFPNKGYFHELFILSIPQGKVQGTCGYVFINEELPDEMARDDRFECLQNIPKIQEENIIKISGKVAVIAQHGASGHLANYYHAICEIFGRLAMIEISGIEYDWLYIPLDKKFIREALHLWGIDTSKVIAATDENFCIQADELIVPSMVINTSCGHSHEGNFQHPTTTEYVRQKLINGARQENIDISKFSKRVFISRKDSYNVRKILNEDDVFKLFQERGFERYEMSKLSVAEQILLFNNAEIVVGEHGAGLTNILFCEPKSKVIEIFQMLIPVHYWWLAHICNLEYIPLKTVQLDANYFANWRNLNRSYFYRYNIAQIKVPLDEIKKIIATL